VAHPETQYGVEMMFGLTRLLWQARRTIQAQQALIARLQRETVAAELAYMRIGRDLIEQFLIALDTPENHDQYRERLASSLSVYKDEICVREEHVR
jgi:hypothetical protein